jgi:AcrR family transcriptional regulator
MAKKNTRKKPKQSRSTEMLNDILQGTKIGLQKFGVDKLSSTKISEITGISVGSFYQSFKNKELAFIELSESLGKNTLTNLLKLLDESDEIPFLERVDSIIDMYAENIINHKSYFNALTHFVVKFNKADLFISNRLKFHQKVTTLIEKESGKAHEECEKFAYFLISNMNGTLHVMAQENQEFLSVPEVQDRLKQVAHLLIEDFMGEKEENDKI